MDCELCRNLMSSYIDKDINEIDKQQVDEHLETCHECKEKYKLLLLTVKACNSMEELDLPQGFHQELHDRLTSLDSKGVKKPSFIKRNINWKWVSGVAAIFLVAMISIPQLYGFLNRKNESIDMAMPQEAGWSGAAESPSQFTMANRAGDGDESAYSTDDIVKGKDSYKLTFDKERDARETEEIDKVYERKIILSASVSLDITNFDDKMREIGVIVESFGGYIESSNIDSDSYQYIEGKKKKYKTGYVSLRVPSDSFTSIIEELKSMGKVKNENTSSRDISEVYYDTRTRIENLNVQENRLRELLALAKNIDEILKIENELNRVRNDIDLMSTDIKRWDKDVSLSSLHLELREIGLDGISEIDVNTTWGKAYKGFIKTINRLIYALEFIFIFFIAFLPYILILLVLLWIGYMVFKKIRTRKID